MKVQEQKSPRRRLSAATAANGAVDNPRQDAGVAQLMATQAEASVADHQVKVALAAYFIAEKRGFEPGHELDDWLAAEAEIDNAAAVVLEKPIQLSPAGSAT